MKIKNYLIALALTTALSAAADDLRYIFYFIGDGMGNGPVMSAQTYKRLVNNDSTLLTMSTLPVASQSTTYSYSSPVTDSAAAGTALATGYKTRNSMLGVTPDSLPVTSIASRLHDLGYGVALVTTVAPDDATPGAFYAHVPSRKMYYEIGRQFAESGFEFLAGASLRGAVDRKTGEPTDLLDYMSANNVAVVSGLDNLNGVDSRRIVLLEPSPFNSSNVGYTIDSIPGMLTLPQMTTAAINHMTNVSPDRFFMMVEGGNIDHSLHSNDAATAIVETLEFDKTLQLALDFYNQHPDETLIIVTADHDTGGMSVGNQAVGYHAYPEKLVGQRVSKDRFSDICNAMLKSRRIITWEDMRETLAEQLGLFSVAEVTAEEEAQLQEVFNRVFVDRNREDQETLYSSINEFAAVAADMLSRKAGFGFTSLAHTGNPVPVYAIGVGAELFGSWNDNTDLPKKIATAVGIDF